MSSLYKISEELFCIFNNIEVAESEITDEQYDALVIKEEELKSKLNDYVKAIRTWEADEKALKEEKKRFGDRQNVFKNRIERLKKAALDAVIAFGEQGRTNKFIELPTYRLSTRSSKSVETDETRINIFMEEFERYIRELVDAGIIYTGTDVDLQGILNAINANVIAQQGESFEPFTLNDLLAIKINISQTASVYDLFKSGLALNMYGKEPAYTKMENVTEKEDWKTIIDSAKVAETSAPTMAKIVTTQSLQIK